MRAILVLLLVLAAAGAFFVVLSKDGGQATGGASLTGPSLPDAAPAPIAPPAVSLGDVPNTPTVRDPGPSIVDPYVDTTQPAGLLDTGRGSLSGSVVDDGGVVIPNAEVRLTRYGAESMIFLAEVGERIPDLTTKTDKDGHFTLDKVPAYDLYSLVVTHPKFSRTERHPVLVQEGRGTEEPTIVLTPGIGLSGQITDSGGNNVSGAKVRLSLVSFATLTNAETDTIETKSDPQGRYAFQNLGTGNYGLSIEADGYGRVDVQNVNIDGKEAATKDFVLQIAHMIGGTVRTVEGLPLADVEVNAYSMDNRTNQSRSQVRTNAKGEFLVPDVPQGRYLLQAQHPDYEMAERQLRVETGEMSVQILMRALPRVRGQVLALGTGLPVTSFTIQLRQPIPNSTSTSAIPQSRVSVVDPDGRFELGAPRPGEYRVHVMAEGYGDTLSAAFTVNAGSDVSNIVVRMIAGGSLRGRVVDSTGRAVAGARVTSHHKDWADDMFSASLADLSPWLATEKSAVTDEQGWYKLSNLMPETYQVVVKHPEYAGTGMNNLLVTDGQESMVREIVLPAGSNVSGVVYGPNGRPLPGALVRLVAEGQFAGSTPGGPYTARADDSGRYEIINVKQGSYGAYATRPRGTGGNPFQESVDMKFTKVVLTVQDGRNLDAQDFKLRDQ